MLGKLILLFVLVPLVDLAILLWLSTYMGWQLSIALVIVSGIVGAVFAKMSYRSVWRRAQTDSLQQQNPTQLLADGAMIFFAAGLLLTPGLVTDAVGFSLLIPRCRRWYQKHVMQWIKQHFSVQVFTNGRREPGNDQVVDGEVVARRSPETQKID